MTPRKIGMLAVLLVALLGVSYLTSRRPGTERVSGLRPGDRLFPDLDLNAVDTVRIVGPEATGTLSRKEGKWVVAGLHDYPADFSVLRQRLRSLGDLKIGQLALGSDDLLDEFGLNAGATRVTLLAKDGSELAGLSLGTTRETGAGGPYGQSYPDGQYVRAGDGPVLLVAGSLSRFSPESADWIDKGLTQVAGGDILHISVASTNGAYDIDFTDGHAMEGLADDEEIDTAAADRLRRALQYMSCITVAGPAGGGDDFGFDAPSTFTALTTNGLFYTALIGGTVENGRYVRFELDYKEPAEVTREEGERDKHTADAQKKLEELAFLEDWTYVVSSPNADALTLGRDEVVKTIEPPEEDEAPNGDLDAGADAGAATPGMTVEPAPAPPRVFTPPKMAPKTPEPGASP